MSDVDPSRAAGGGRPARLRRLLHRLRTEHSSPDRDPIAVALGVFIGCTPLYGLHLAISILAASLFRVNKLKVYLAANISNPFVFPFLVFSEIQTGALLRTGAFHPLTREAIAATSPWSYGLDLVVGSVVVGLILAAVFGTLTFALMRNSRNDAAYSALVARAAERYAPASFTAWEFANGKLRGDPVYRQALDARVLPGGDTLVDVGCGQGLMLALLVEARAAYDDGGAHAQAQVQPQWPRYARLIGIESRPRTASIASLALAGPGVDILSADGRETAIPACDAILLFDVLHMMPIPDQDALLAAVRTALRPGGIALVREADASGGWRFLLVRTGNRLKALLSGNWRQPLVFRRPDEWIDAFQRAGFAVETFPGPEGHPFANTLFRLGPRYTQADARSAGSAAV